MQSNGLKALNIFEQLNQLNPDVYEQHIAGFRQV